jgi:hypothetical protein
MSRKAEILSLREKKISRAEKKKKKAEEEMEVNGGTTATSTTEYYVHYVEFNKVGRPLVYSPSSPLG